MMASGRAAFASGGEISGSGLAMAKMIGFAAMSRTISGFTAPAADSPRKMSAPFNASSRVLADVLAAWADFHWSIPSGRPWRSEEHTSELQSLMRISYAVFCLKKQTETYIQHN